MKIVGAQLNYNIADFEGNTRQIITAIESAKEENADLVIFSELAVTGYPPRDFLDYPEFLSEVESCLDLIKKASKGIAVLVGAPRRSHLKYGRSLYNSAFLFSDGEKVKVFDKVLLPTYDIFDEKRYFESGKQLEYFEINGRKYGVAICEDIWNRSNQLYQKDPLDVFKDVDLDGLIALSASPFDYTQQSTREKLLARIAQDLKVDVYYINQVGSYTDILFDGGSMLVNADGCVTRRFKHFHKEIALFNEGEVSKIQPKIAQMHDALVVGIRDYFQKLGFKKAVLGLSGGIDSAIIAVLACRALAPENVHCVLLPSKFSSDHSISDALDLIDNLKCSHEIVNIQSAVDAIEKGLFKNFEGTPVGLAEENIQARTRGVILMAISNKHGHLLLNTSNKSEMSVGYSTLYGDMCGALAAIADVYKTEIFELARFINKPQEVIPINIITKPPSAELRPDQKDSDSLPDYSVLDEILRCYIDKQWTKKQILEAGFDTKLVEKILGLVNRSEHKRYQSPPVLKVSPKAFGTGRRMPIVARFS